MRKKLAKSSSELSINEIPKPREGNYKEVKDSIKNLYVERFKDEERELHKRVDEAVGEIVGNFEEVVQTEKMSTEGMTKERRKQLDEAKKKAIDEAKKKFRKDLMDATIKLSMRDIEERVFLYDRISRKLAKAEDEASARSRDKDVADATHKMNKNDESRRKLIDEADKELQELQKLVQRLEHTHQGIHHSGFYATFALYEQAQADAKSDPTSAKRAREKAKEARKSPAAEQRVQRARNDETLTNATVTALQTINDQTTTPLERKEAVEHLITETVQRDAILEAQYNAIHGDPFVDYTAIQEKATQEVRNSPTVTSRQSEALGLKSVQKAIELAQTAPSPADHAARGEALKEVIRKTIRRSVADETQTAVIQEAAGERFITYIKAGIDTRGKIMLEAARGNNDLRTLQRTLCEHDEVRLALAHISHLSPHAATAITKLRQEKYYASHMDDVIETITAEDAERTMAYYKKMQSITSTSIPEFVRSYVHNNSNDAVHAYEKATADSRFVSEYLDELTLVRPIDANKEQLAKDATAAMIADSICTEAVATRLNVLKGHKDMSTLLPGDTPPHKDEEAALIRAVASKAASLNIALQVRAGVERDAQQQIRHNPIVSKAIEDAHNAPGTTEIITALQADDKTTQAITKLITPAKGTSQVKIIKYFINEMFLDAYARRATANSIDATEAAERKNAQNDNWVRHDSIIQQHSIASLSALRQVENITRAEGDQEAQERAVKAVLDRLIHKITLAATETRVRNQALAEPFAKGRLAQLTASWEATAKVASKTKLARQTAKNASTSVAVTYDGSLEYYLDHIMKTTIEKSLKTEWKTLIEHHPNYFDNSKAQQPQSAAHTSLREQVKADYQTKIDRADKKYVQELEQADKTYDKIKAEAESQRDKVMKRAKKQGPVHGEAQINKAKEKYQKMCNEAQEERTKAKEEANNRREKVYAEQQTALAAAERIYDLAKTSTIQGEIEQVKKNLLDITSKRDLTFKERKDIFEKKEKDEEMARVKRTKWDVQAVYLQGKQIAQKEKVGEALAALNTAESITAEAKQALDNANAQLVFHKNNREQAQTKIDHLYGLSMKKSLDSDKKKALEAQIEDANKKLKTFSPILQNANQQVLDCQIKYNEAVKEEKGAKGIYNEKKHKIDVIEEELALSLKRHESHKDKRTRYRDRIAKLDEDQIKYMRNRELALRILLVMAAATACGASQKFSATVRQRPI